MPDSGIDSQCHRRSTSNDNSDEGSCFYSTYGDDDPEIGHVSVSSLDAAAIRDENQVVILHLVDRDCRICHLSLVDDGDGDVIDLGCCCKDDLAAAHKHCAETWFKIRGNKTCEICNSIVSNLVVPNEVLSTAMMMDVNLEVAESAGGVSSSTRSGVRGRGEGCINGHRLLNFILACLVFAFVISWLFHFNIPS